MATTALPSAMRIWKYDSTAGGLENHLRLHTSETLPTPTPTQHLVRILAVSLNPVDFKPAEAPLVGRLAVKLPATPGFDIAGRIVTPAKDSDLEAGDTVFGAVSTNPLAGGALAEYAAVSTKTVCKLPAGVKPLVAAGAPVAAVTAYGSIIPYVGAGSRVFINGGSGGVGTYGTQIAKAAGAHVNVSCSGRNAELCRPLGADEVLDYAAAPLLDQLRDAVATAGRPFDHVVDNVFSDPELYYKAHTYTTPEARFVEVASAPSLAFARFALGAMTLPGFLGGGRRKVVMAAGNINPESLKKVADWIVEGKIKPVTDKIFAFEEVVEAYKHLKTGRAKGKIIVNVAGEKY